MWLVVLSSFFSSLKSTAVAMMYTKLYNEMAKRLFKALIKQDIAFYDNAMTGQLTSRLTNDLSQATFPIPIVMNALLANIVMLVVGFSLCLSASWRLTVLALSFLSPVVYVSGIYNRWARQIQAAQWTYTYLFIRPWGAEYN